MKKLNKILTCVAFALAIVVLAMALMQREWITSLLITALLFDWWIIYKDEETIIRYRDIALDSAKKILDYDIELSTSKEEHSKLIAKIADVDRDNAQLRKGLAEAKKREDIAHKTIEDQRKVNHDLEQAVISLENQMEALNAQNTTLRYKLSRKPHKKRPVEAQQNE